MGNAGSCQNVGGARPCRTGGKHETLAQFLLGIGHSGHRHGLLVLTAIKRQFFAVLIQGLTKACDVAVAKNTEATSAQADPFTINLNILIGQVSNDGFAPSSV